MLGSPREPAFPSAGRPDPGCEGTGSMPAGAAAPGGRAAERPAVADRPGMLGRIFGGRVGGGAEPPRMQVRAAESGSAESPQPQGRGEDVQPSRPPAYPVRSQADGGGPVRAEPEKVSRELGERVQTGFQDLSRLLGAIKETLQGRDGQVQQTLQALPDFLQQVPRIHRAEIECLAQISKQLEHMGSGTRDVIARLDGLPDLLRTLMVGQAQQAQFLDGLQARMAETLDVQAQALRQGLETSRKGAEAQLGMIRSLAATQEDIFATFQNTQNRALNVFHRAQQQSNAQHRETQTVMNRQIEMLVGKVHSAQTRVFWLSIGFAALAAAGMILALLL